MNALNIPPGVSLSINDLLSSLPKTHEWRVTVEPSRYMDQSSWFVCKLGADNAPFELSFRLRPTSSGVETRYGYSVVCTTRGFPHIAEMWPDVAYEDEAMMDDPGILENIRHYDALYKCIKAWALGLYE